MGTRMAPTYTNLFMENLNNTPCSSLSLIWWRFVDDVFMIWTEGEGHLKDFISYLRADVSKNQTLAGNSQKIDFAHTFKFDTLSC